MPSEGSLFSNRADGGSMAYRRIGEGMVVVCLAGGPGANAEYLEDLGGLSRDHQLVSPDSRGTGKSPAPETLAGYGFDELAEDVEVLREHLGLEKMTLLAHSAACTTAQVYAATPPDRLRAWWHQADGSTRDRRRRDPATGAVRMFWQAHVDGQEVRARLGLVEAPVLVITGELDATTGVIQEKIGQGVSPTPATRA